ncbi:hypothetical protein [Nitrosomonas supralitoralis]|uniref:hypothetical protein n=1 Tax=Nitrosomonas supralitoralis TaxID=2116706 RepID=UPI0015589C09|nr:hypothetical protein [Nitrosomonas supralitoralis]
MARTIRARCNAGRKEIAFRPGWPIAQQTQRGVTAKINSPLRPYKHKCHTVTFVIGKEFSQHETIALELEADIKGCTSNSNPPNFSESSVLRLINQTSKVALRIRIRLLRPCAKWERAQIGIK